MCTPCLLSSASRGNGTSYLRTWSLPPPNRRGISEKHANVGFPLELFMPAAVILGLSGTKVNKEWVMGHISFKCLHASS